MTDALRDNNHVATKLGVLYSDGVTLVPIAINPVNKGIKVDTVNTIGFTPDTNALRDGNYEHVLMAVNSVDGTPCPVYVNASGEVLIDN